MVAEVWRMENDDRKPSGNAKADQRHPEKRLRASKLDKKYLESLPASTDPEGVFHSFDRRYGSDCCDVEALKLYPLRQLCMLLSFWSPAKSKRLCRRLYTFCEQLPSANSLSKRALTIQPTPMRAFTGLELTGRALNQRHRHPSIDTVWWRLIHYAALLCHGQMGCGAKLHHNVARTASPRRSMAVYSEQSTKLYCLVFHPGKFHHL